MVELNAASESEIQDELRRREMIARNAKIKDHVNAISYAYNSGKISRIEVIEDNKGTSAQTTKYIVFMM